MSNFNESSRFNGTILSPKISTTTKKREYASRKGIGFPFKASGPYVNRSVEVALAKSNLRQLLNTVPGERVMVPKFGCDLNSLLFEPFDENLVIEAKERITTSISKFIPYIQINRIKVIRLEESSRFGVPTLLISLYCQIKDDENALFEVDVKL